MKLKSFFGVSYRRKYLFAWVVWLSIQKKIYEWMKSPKASSEFLCRHTPKKAIIQSNGIDVGLVKDIAFAIHLGSKYIPWENVCRHQAWQAIKILNSYHIPHVYHVGVKKFPQIEGHSWVKVGDRFVSGACKESEYQLLFVH
ncbi:lasso peptide biosynthesis B2 protein [Mongoliitalea lutea]|uniref:Microcin J25-processing protein McjB C-terminal domain-containing protein n=1 Tax=Mongoliitalea lutea TaxID=849756 RepID=A0A8J3CZ13_9BACT|nr:lasso peptide biosynthesis B2 protein [Mongoliitalea lutea]GHB36983.1 hypothetical protein GCM10008106_17830 [Mongoliitalea lutea]